MPKFGSYNKKIFKRIISSSNTSLATRDRWHWAAALEAAYPLEKTWANALESCHEDEKCVGLSRNRRKIHPTNITNMTTDNRETITKQKAMLSVGNRWILGGTQGPNYSDGVCVGCGAPSRRRVSV